MAAGDCPEVKNADPSANAAQPKASPIGTRSAWIMPAIADVAKHLTRGQNHYCPGEGSNECARDIDSRSSSHCKVAEDRTRDHGADDTQSEVQYHALAGTLKEPAGYVAGAKTEQDEDND
jgi:hypothetical protein